MQASVQYLDGVKFEVHARSHRILCDQPLSNQGEDQGMTPPELLLASIGTCVGYYAVEYLKSRHVATAGLQVFVEAEKALQPARLGSFRIRIESPSPLEDRHREGLLRAAHRCLIHNTLMHPPAVEFTVDAPVQVPAA